QGKLHISNRQGDDYGVNLYYTINVPEYNTATLVELEPDLEACVETQAKRQYNQIARELLSKEGEELAGKPEYEIKVME
ncbi:hypothetical protein ACFLXO_08745, partial [Chloroflexota bacterium]